MKNKVFKKGEKNLLKTAFSQLLKIFPNEVVLNKLKDNFGTYAIETNHFLLTAKEYIYKGIVSAHSQAIYQAWIKNKPLLMFIAKENRFLQFNPQKIFDNSYLNNRGSVTMLNFEIKLAEKVFANSNTLEAWLK